MARFITRIQLYSASETDYSTLHSEMKKEAFSIVKEFRRESEGSESPTEEYIKNGATLVDVNSAVLRAARKTGKEYKFTVMKENLSEVRSTGYEERSKKAL